MTSILRGGRFGRPANRNYIALFIAAACCVVMAVGAQPIWTAREVALQEDHMETGNLARSLAQHAHGTIETADTSLIALRQEVELSGLHASDLPKLHAMMAEYVAARPMLNGLFIYDATGGWVVNSLSAHPAATLNNADRSYFQYHRDHAMRAVHVDPPIRSKSDNRWILPVSRRIDNADGSFGGVVLATVSIDFFQRFYQTFDPGQAGAISLASVDGRVVARNPIDEAAIGKDYSKGPIFSQLAPDVREQTFGYTSVNDGVERFGSVSRVAEYPLLVIVSHSVAEALNQWWANTLHYLILASVSAGALIFLGLRMAMLIRRREQTELQYHLLADHSSDAIVCATMDGQPIFVSPAFYTLTGWSVEERLGLRWDSIVHPDDKAMIAANLETLRSGAPEASVIYRYLRKDGLAVWVEARIRILPGRNGAEDRLIANVRDITKRKKAEDMVAALNEELRVQAMTDGLTGLANRRSFDERLKTEWARAARTGTPLSLLLVDVDRFKLYNDRYGHQKGDACLREVAETIAGATRRPADFVARYGGEEIVVILPGIDHAGVREIGDGMRSAVQSRSIEHEDNSPWRVVTASFGAATCWPQPHDGVTAEQLVARADAALYKAKETGRNKLMLAGGMLKAAASR